MATRTYTGNAQAINQVDSVTIAGVWAAADTLTIGVNGKELVLTVGTAVATTDVATALKQAIQSETMGAGYSVLPSGGGTAIPELSVITASVSGSVVTLTADTAGVPFTITATEVTAGTGTATRAAVTACTGPAYYGNVDNWLEGSAATTGDDMIWNRAVSIKYDLAQSAITLASLTIGPAVTTAYQIGLLARNALGYEEYLPTELAISATTIICNGTPGLMKLNLGSAQTTATINSSGTSLESSRPAIQIRGTHASNVINVFGGDNGFAFNDETATVATINQDGGTIQVGKNTTLTTVAKLAGTATIRCAVTTVSSASGALTQRDGAVTTATISGGTATFSGTGALTTVNQSGGTVTVLLTRGTITTYNKLAGSAIVGTTITNITNLAGSFTQTTGNVTSLTTGGTYSHSGSVTISAIVQTGGTVTLTHASSVVTLLTKSAGAAYLNGSCVTSVNQTGALTIGTGNVTAITTYGGEVSYGGAGTLTLVNQYGGSFTSAVGSTVTTYNKYGGSGVVLGTATTTANVSGSLEIQSGAITSLIVSDGTVKVYGAGTLALLRQSGGSVTVGATVTSVTSLDKSGGTCTSFCAVVTAVNEGGSLTLASGNSTTITGVNGTIRYNGAGTLTTVTLTNATVFDVDGGTAGMTITNLSLGDNVTFRNSTGRVTLTNPTLPTGILKLSPA